ncbi:hypothetical protein DWZ76_11390 [Clostridium sp. AF35-15]|nr:hypothetical protein DWZ76_11390 [Clostridium sp. AF35-15]
MGGRGSSSGMSDKDNAYASQYHTVLKSGNMKFVAANDRHSESLFETQTKGRVYVTVAGNDLLKITYYDRKNKRTKQIDLNHVHKGMKPHTHHGYNHNENDSAKGASNLTTEEKKMVERAKQIWYNRSKR